MRISSNLNYIKSSNLFFISAGLGLINFLLSPDILLTKSATITSVIVISIIFVLGLLIRFEISWVKYLLIVIIIFGINAFPSFIKEEFNSHPLNALITILQSIAQIYATVLLFFKKKLNY
jgi:hypothetical protein